MKKASVFLFSLVIMMFAFTGCKGVGKIALNDYIDLSFEGLNGDGRAVVDIDLVGIETNILNVTTINTKREKDKNALLDFILSVDYEIDKKDGLKNGDKVTAKVTYDSKAASVLGIIVESDSVTKKVENLVDGKKIDLFKGMEIVVEGVSPNLEVSANSENSTDEFIKNNITYEIKPNKGLASGDEVTVYAKYDSKVMEAEGFIPKEKEKVVKVKAKSSLTYVENYKDIGKKNIEQIEGVALKVLNEELSRRGYAIFSSAINGFPSELGDASAFTHTAPKKVATYFVKSKSGAHPENEIEYSGMYIIYEAKSPDFTKNGESVPVYFAVLVPEITTARFGKVSFDETKVIYSTSKASLEEMEEKLIVEKSENYDAEIIKP